MTIPQDLADWLVGQRWYAGPADARALEVVGELALPDGFRTLLLGDGSGPVIQVPVGPDGRDATADPTFGSALLAAMGVPGYGESRAMGVEQSNTSLVVRGPQVAPAIVKVYRVAHTGAHPEVEISRMLAGTGAPVPAHVGDLEGTWTIGDRTVTGSLAVAQEFVEGPGDGWRVALEAAGAGDPFLAEAHELGRATAELHLALASALPTTEPTDEDRRRVLGEWRGRLARATESAPAVAELAASAVSAFEIAAQVPWPTLQRVHGDLHLGQVLVADSGARWRFADFEGEPLRPLAERSGPDFALRDVAGMLRSFGYAAASVPAAPAGWAEGCTQAFAAGYDEVAPAAATAHRVLLRALVLDKALYEVAYEARHRPSWVGIPLTAVHDLVSDGTTSP